MEPWELRLDHGVNGSLSLPLTPLVAVYAAYCADSIERDVPPVDFETWRDARDTAYIILEHKAPDQEVAGMFQIYRYSWDEQQRKPSLRIELVDEIKIGMFGYEVSRGVAQDRVDALNAA